MLFLLWPMAPLAAALPAVGVANWDMLRPIAPPPSFFRSRAFRNKLLVLGRRFSVDGGAEPPALLVALPGSDFMISEVEERLKLGLLVMDR